MSLTFIKQEETKKEYIWCSNVEMFPSSMHSADTCLPPSGAQAKSQEVPTPLLDFDRRAIMVYGIPASDDPSPSTRVEYDISRLRFYFRNVLTEDESVSVCKAYHTSIGRPARAQFQMVSL